MPTTTKSGVLPVREVASSAAADRGSFSSVLQASQPRLSLPIPTTTNVRMMDAGGKGVSESEPNKPDSLQRLLWNTAATTGSPALRGQSKPNTSTKDPETPDTMPLALSQLTTDADRGQAAKALEPATTLLGASLAKAVKVPASELNKTGAGEQTRPAIHGQTQHVAVLEEPVAAVQVQPTPSAQTQTALVASAPLFLGGQVLSAVDQQTPFGTDALASPSIASQMQLVMSTLPSLGVSQASSAITAPVGPALAASLSPTMENVTESSTAMPQASATAQAGTPAQTEREASISALLPRVSESSPAPGQINGGSADQLSAISDAQSTSADRVRKTAAASLPLENTPKGPPRASASSDSGKSSDQSAVAPTNAGTTTSPTAATERIAGAQAPAVLTPEALPTSPTSALPSMPAGENVNATQGSLAGGAAVITTSTRREKSIADGSATASSAPISNGTTATAAAPGSARDFEGVANPAAVANLRDTDTLGTSSQASPKVSGHGAGEIVGTTAPEPDLNQGGGLASLTQARVLHSLAGSEMHVNLNSDEFGRVAVHATYGREAIITEISLENSAMGNALGSALNAHLSTLETRLGQEHGLASSVTLSTQTLDSGATGQGHGSDSQSQPRSYPGSQHGRSSPGSSLSSPSTDALSFADQSTPALTEAGSSRLDIRI